MNGITEATFWVDNQNAAAVKQIIEHPDSITMKTSKDLLNVMDSLQIYGGFNPNGTMATNTKCPCHSLCNACAQVKGCFNPQYMCS